MRQKLLSLRNEFNSIANNFEQELKEMHKEELQQALRRGKRDGLENIPPADSTKMNAVEREIFHSYNALLHEFRFDVEGLLTRIKTDHVAILDAQSRKQAQIVSKELKELEEKTYRELKRLEEEHHEQLELLEEDSEHTNLREKKLEADEVFEELCLQTGRRSSDIVWDAPGLLYGLIFILLGIAEVAAMYNAFLGFEEPPLTTWAWAIGFGLVMAVLSHFNGIVFARSRAHKWDIWKGIVIAAIALVVIIIVSEVRTAAMDEDVPVKHISLPAFIAISFVIYIVGVFLSYLSHDSNNRFYRALKNREKLQEQVHQRKKQLYEERVKLQKQLQEKERAINDAFEEKRAQIEGQAE